MGMKNKSCPNELKFCEDSRNPGSVKGYKNLKIGIEPTFLEYCPVSTSR